MVGQQHQHGVEQGHIVGRAWPAQGLQRRHGHRGAGRRAHKAPRLAQHPQAAGQREHQLAGSLQRVAVHQAGSGRAPAQAQLQHGHGQDLGHLFLGHGGRELAQQRAQGRGQLGRAPHHGLLVPQPAP